jgi:hypothetical protein
MLPVPSEHANVSTNTATSGVGRVVAVVGVALDSGAGCGCVLKLSDMQASIRILQVHATMNTCARFVRLAHSSLQFMGECYNFQRLAYLSCDASRWNFFVLVAQLDRASPSDGEGCAFDPHQGRFL